MWSYWPLVATMLGIIASGMMGYGFGRSRGFREGVESEWTRQVKLAFPKLEEDRNRATDIPSCDGCGACCMKIGVPPFDESEGTLDREDLDFQVLPLELAAEVEQAFSRGAESFVGKPCIWFDSESRRCKHYEWRPVLCLEFEPGNPICLEDRDG